MVGKPSAASLSFMLPVTLPTAGASLARESVSVCLSTCVPVCLCARARARACHTHTTLLPTHAGSRKPRRKAQRVGGGTTWALSLFALLPVGRGEGPDEAIQKKAMRVASLGVEVPITS